MVRLPLFHLCRVPPAFTTNGTPATDPINTLDSSSSALVVSDALEPVRLRNITSVSVLLKALDSVLSVYSVPFIAKQSSSITNGWQLASLVVPTLVILVW